MPRRPLPPPPAADRAADSADTAGAPARPAPPRSSRRALLRQAGSLVLLLGAADLARGATLLAVRVWPAEDHTRVTLESDTRLSARHFLAENPARVVIDIDGLLLSATLRELVAKVRGDDPYIAGVRVAQFSPQTVRLVLDLKQATAPQVFGLEPVAAYGHRLVFDLHPAVAPDPLLALLNERGLASPSSREAAEAVGDALGEFIGRMERGGSGPNAGPGGPASAAGPSPAAPAAGSSAPTPPAAAGPPPPGRDAPAGTERLIVVALDPGHGGEDPGAIGPSGLQEKQVVLQIALQLRERLNALPAIRAYLTRDADFFVPLHERVRRARRVQADLFVSIHADAFIRREARGASVYALSETGATSAAARWMAQKENESDRIGGINRVHHDPQLNRTLVEMSTAAQIRDSLKLGAEVLRGMGRVGRLHKPQVEQAGFAVLKAPDIPSILVETAFISNPEEEQLLRDAAYQRRLVDALAAGIQRYFVLHPPRARTRAL